MELVCGVQPQFPPCMTPDAKVLSVLREHFFLKPQGLPFSPPLQLRAFPSITIPDAQSLKGQGKEGESDASGGSGDW